MKMPFWLIILPAMCALILISSCDLPSDISKLIKTHFTGGGGNTNAVLPPTIYLAGINNLSNVCLWTIHPDNSITSNIIFAPRGSAGARPYLYNGQLYIPGSAGQYTVDPRMGCYWTISTNGGAVTEVDLSPPPSIYGGAISAVAVDVNGTVWAVGTDAGEYPVLYTNGVAVSLGNNAWNSAYCIQFEGTDSYITVRSNNCYWIDKNGTMIIPSAGNYWPAGMVVTNGNIFINMDHGGGAGYLLISSNQGGTWFEVALPNGVPYGNGICYDNGMIFTCGSTTSGFPCYWTFQSDGSVNQFVLPVQGAIGGRVQDIQVYYGTVYAAGTETISGNGVACYWIGTNEIILDPGNCQSYGGYSGLNGILIPR